MYGLYIFKRGKDIDLTFNNDHRRIPECKTFSRVKGVKNNEAQKADKEKKKTPEIRNTVNVLISI